MSKFSKRPSRSFHSQVVPQSDLELPNAPDFVSHRSRLSLQEMLPLLEHWRQWSPKAAITPEHQFAGKCDVEFVL